MTAKQFVFGNGEMTAEEKQALADFQNRINQDTGELEPEKTIIQTAPILEVMYNAEISNEDYHQAKDRLFSGVSFKDILSAGKLKSCTTPLHLKRELENPPAQREAFNTGSAFHSMILEPEKFEYELFNDDEIIAGILRKRPEIKNVKATSEYKEWFSQYQDSEGNLRDNVLSKEAFQSMWALKKKLTHDKVVYDLFEGSQPEHSIFIKFDVRKANHEFLTVKVRPDGIKLASRKDAENLKDYGVKFGDLIIISVKTTVDASPAGFLKQCIRLGYNITEAFYYDVITRWAHDMNLIKSENKIHTVFLTLEKEGNNLTGHYMVRPSTPEFIQWGRYDYARNLNIYMNSIDLTEGYEAMNNGSTICPISAPSGYGRS